MNLYGLTVNHRAAPLGVAPVETPYFGWKLESQTHDTLQNAYRLQLYADESICFDSGRICCPSPQTAPSAKRLAGSGTFPFTPKPHC